MIAPEARPDPLEALITYIRTSYAPTAPTRRLLTAYEAQAAELERLRVEVAALRQALALNNFEVGEDEEKH
jgi:hypothetical protein